MTSATSVSGWNAGSESARVRSEPLARSTNGRRFYWGAVKGRDFRPTTVRRLTRSSTRSSYDVRPRWFAAQIIRSQVENVCVGGNVGETSDRWLRRPGWRPRVQVHPQTEPSPSSVVPSFAGGRPASAATVAPVRCDPVGTEPSRARSVGGERRQAAPDNKIAALVSDHDPNGLRCCGTGRGCATAARFPFQLAEARPMLTVRVALPRRGVETSKT